MPIDDCCEGNDSAADHDWCDLEILAREIYKRHVNTYNLHTSTSSGGEKKSFSGKNSGCTATEDAAKSGAEWWVQVKPAGSNKTPVDLHYDKDEALAEAFCLGSFPTLSTVTYLTGDGTGGHDENKNASGAPKDDEKSSIICKLGGMDAAPTVVFPHTYHDDEDAPINAMLISHPLRGKHLVFDGRLLHGAPGHPALRLGGDNAAAGANETNNNTDMENDSLLRVTFLVNIWRTGRPASVHILPSSTRDMIKAAAAEQTNPGCDDSFADILPMTFEKRAVPQYDAPSKLSLALSANPMETQFILPFVSKGATWISDDDSVDVKDQSSNNWISDRDGDVMITNNNEVEEGNDDEEEEDELFLQLPRFTTQEYLDDGADTALFLFECGNEARLTRRDVKRN
jgi:hypothetical protein